LNAVPDHGGSVFYGHSFFYKKYNNNPSTYL
jgi:hypothetical protein